MVKNIKALDTQEMIESKLEDMGIEQLVLLDDPIIIQSKDYKMVEAYMVYVGSGYLQYFDGSLFRRFNFARILTISK